MGYECSLSGMLMSTRTFIQAMGLPGPSLDFKADRVENRVGLNGRAALCTLDCEGDGASSWRQQKILCSAYIQDRIVTVHRVLVR